MGDTSMDGGAVDVVAVADMYGGDDAVERGGLATDLYSYLVLSCFPDQVDTDSLESLERGILQDHSYANFPFNTAVALLISTPH